MDIKKAKLEKLLMEELAGFVMRELKDPRLPTVVITHVELSKDKTHAKIYFTTLEEGLEKEAEQVLEGAKNHIRAELTKRLRVRRLPELHFVFDRELKRMEKIWERL
ncbi:MAG: 30S ribosome-binding factor RbfA [Aquificaceae bacterium]|nr:30S ribosome-binding factor RbfA [Aquificaceae bacterium]MCS7307325.1 30S ribosome-binding factor RbfA [Aquificaceae bacterium]MCX8076026.1 30S ribosome-binding factor RbfA [Aquificaceae bacterium]MDW8095570.1 30S ribosome-binding factor RbfA [Aquificaceae bacterium]MDW8433322.1 30S ribosome-binding factor RbfA [Aquificaceae bacterium]